MFNIKTINNTKHIIITGIPNPFHNLYMQANYGQYNEEIIFQLMNEIKHVHIKRYDEIYELYHTMYEKNSYVIPLNPFNRSISTFKRRFKTLYLVGSGKIHRENLKLSIDVLFKDPFND